MSGLPANLRDVDWSTTTFEGARREQMRQWAAMSLEEVVKNLEEMERIPEESQCEER